MAVFSQNDAPILVVMGQSNAHGHGTSLAEDERITTPLSNVFGLSCEQNQAYGLSDVAWSGFTSFGMNLGETQDNTCCLAGEFARLWQRDTDNGIALPSLYVIQISIGAQGIAAQERDGLNMWYPKRSPIIAKGNLGEVNISLYPLATAIISLAMKNLKSAGKTPIVVGLHWNQWETEAHTGGLSIENAETNYREFFKGFDKAIGQEYPLWLYYPLSRVYNNPYGVEKLIELFERLKSESKNIFMMNPREHKDFDPLTDTQGIFQPDCVHYSPKLHKWFAEKQYEFTFKK